MRAIEISSFGAPDVLRLVERPRPVAFKAEIARALYRNIWPLVESGRIRPVIHAVFPAAEAARAHALMESSAHIGKIVLTWE